MFRICCTAVSLAVLASLARTQEPTPAPAPPVVEEPKPVPTQEPKPVEQPAPQEPDVPPQEDPAPAPAPADKGDKGDQEPGEKPGDAERDAPRPSDETEVDLPEDTPLPAGADPADLRAMKSAQDMVGAERRLRAAIKAGRIKDVDKLLSFEEISSWPYRDGLEGMPKAVRELDGKEVVMIGFMLPIDEVEDIKEFLLVQSLWACCYGTPPDIHGIVRVVMKGDKRADYQFDPIQVRGTFEVEATTEDGYVIDIYQLHAGSVSLVK